MVKVIEQKYDETGSYKTIIFKTNNVEEAIDYVKNMSEPISERMRKAWNLVEECDFDDGIAANNIERSFKYQHIKDKSDIMIYKYYIEHSSLKTEMGKEDTMDDYMHHLNLSDDFNFHCREVNEFWDKIFPMQCMEECSELIQAISKYEREKAGFKVNRDTRQGVIDEIGDVLIDIYALCNRYRISDEEIDERIDYKMHKSYS